MRLFVGIPLPNVASRELARIIERLRREIRNATGLRWTQPDSWHITLQFLGNTTAERLECLKARLSQVRAAPVAVAPGELASFDRAGVLFVGVTATPELAALERGVVAATTRCGFAAETRAFRPHITLARKSGDKRPREPRDILRESIAKAGKEAAFTRFTAHEFVLFESHLGADRARYEALLRVALGGPTPDGNG